MSAGQENVPFAGRVRFYTNHRIILDGADTFLGCRQCPGGVVELWNRETGRFYIEQKDGFLCSLAGPMAGENAARQERLEKIIRAIFEP